MRILLDLRGLAKLAYRGGNIVDTVTNDDGEQVPTAAHGVATFIRYTLTPLLDAGHQPINIIGVLEGTNNTGNVRRRAILETYKNKPSDDDGDRVQKEQREKCFQLIQNLILALGGTLVKTPYAEADDTIAYLCQRLQGPKIVHTVDGDLTQLHSKDVAVAVRGEYVNSYKSINFDEVTPKMVVLYKSIVGDSSDCYPGVRGMGEKAWEALVEAYEWDGMKQLYQCVENADYSMIEESLAASEDKLLRKLYDAREQWRCSFLLASLHPEWCESSYANKDVRPVWAKRVPTKERLEKVLVPLGLEPLVQKFSKYLVKKIGIDANTKVNWESMYQEMRRSPVVPFDYESYDSLKHPDYQKARDGYVDVLSQRITGCSFSFGENLQYCAYLSVKHRDAVNLPESKVLEVLNMLDKKGMPRLVAQNASFEMTLTKTNFDKEFQEPIYDTRVMASYFNENGPDGLKHMSKAYLNYDQTSYNDVVKPGEDMRDVSLAEVMDYGCDDSICTGHLFVLYKLVMECEQTWDFYKNNEPYFDKEMVKSFVKGVNIDFDELHRQADEDSTTRYKTMKVLRGILEENCLEVNQQGFEVLWPEVKDYTETALREKGVEEDQIAAKLEEAKEACYKACAYTPMSAVTVCRSTKLYSTISKHLGFPGIRSNKQEWLQKFSKGIKDQAAAQEYELSELQQKFLDKLDGDPLELYDFCMSMMSEDEELWEGDELNIGSPKQMGELFYGKMGLPILLRNIDKNSVKPNKRTVWDLEQAPSTDILAIESWMAELEESDWKYKVLECVKVLRAIKTKFGLYYKPYPLFRSPVDGRIHPSIKNCGTTTKRPSSSSPNLLQLSKKDEARFRRVVLPLDDGEEQQVIVSIDFVQQELVVLAGLSDDKNLRSCYQGENKKDVHSLTGTGIYNLQQARRGHGTVSYYDFTVLAKNKAHEASVIRKKPAKITNFLMVYGGSPQGLSRKATVPVKVAEQWVDVFFDTYPGVKRYQEKMTNFVRRHGYVTTCYGTRRHLDTVFSPNKGLASSAERQAVNAPIQGTCADLLKTLFRKISLNDLTARLGATIYAPVYDEIIASVPVSKVYEWCESLADMMEIELPGLRIDLTTSVSIGINAGDQIELEGRPSKETIENCLAQILPMREAA